MPVSSVPAPIEDAESPEADESHGESITNAGTAGQTEDSQPETDPGATGAGSEAEPETADTEGEPSRDERCEPLVPPPLVAYDDGDTWEGTPIIVPRKAVGLTAGEAPIAPAALQPLDGAELVFHGACEVQAFERDGTLKREWAFDQPVQNVYADGGGGVVYEQIGDSTHNRELRWWPAGADEPTVLLTGIFTFGDGGFESYFGVTVVEDSPVVLYTTIEWPEDEDECVGCNPNYLEVLYRRELLGTDSLRLGDVGGHEWAFEPKAITPEAIYGFNSTDGGQWNSAVATDPESRDEVSFITRTDDFDGDCFDRPDSLICPTLIVPVGDGFVVGFVAFSDGHDARLYVLARVDGTSGEIVEFFPVVLTGSGWNVLGVQVSGQRVVLNRSSAQTHLGGRRTENLRRPIIVDLASRTAEVYDRYGTLHLTQSWDHPS